MSPTGSELLGARLAIFAFYAAIYFLPAIAGWLVAQFTGAALPLQRLFVVNALIGWTGLGWIACWVYLIVQMGKARAARTGGTAGGGGGYTSGTSSYTAPTYQPPSEPQQRRTCGSCGGSGKTNCSMCAGQGGRWTQPVTANDTSRWDACGSCASSGKVACSSCSGSGYAF